MGPNVPRDQLYLRHNLIQWIDLSRQIDSYSQLCIYRLGIPYFPLWDDGITHVRTTNIDSMSISSLSTECYGCGSGFRSKINVWTEHIFDTRNLFSFPTFILSLQTFTCFPWSLFHTSIAKNEKKKMKINNYNFKKQEESKASQWLICVSSN